ncbi:uncharacterized protein FYW49_019895 [Xenentodon cancila]
MTKGVAGIGKTVLTQKFTLDWAEGRANQDIRFIFPFTFRELNVLKERKFSLVELVHHFFTETKDIYSVEDCQVVFIFDGLDECRLPLDFHNNEILTDVTECTSVDVLLTNLIRGNLLPSARLWITTRPAAANQISPECVSMVTEVRGFTNPQKEEYFRKRFRDEEQTSRIISHIKTSQSLHIMCHIPVFCWITATVLETVLETREGGGLPKTLTEMYIHFLVVQTKLKKVKYDGGAETDPHWSPESRKMMECLGKLAFEQLQKGNLIFYESDLRECGIDIREASVYSGVFTQIFKEEKHLYQHKVFCFIHLSVQEFLAALHVHLTFINSGANLLEEQKNRWFRLFETTEETLYQTAVDKALQSPNGHLDLFLRFLLGLSLETNQTLLRGLLKPKQESSQNNQVTAGYIKKKISEDLSAEKSINLFHCLNELNEGSLVEEVQQSLRSGCLSSVQLSPAQWSALGFILLSSEEDLEVFDLKKYSASEEVLLRLLPVVKASKKVLLSGCNLSEEVCAGLSSVLSSQSSSLTELDLSNNHLQDSGLEKLCPGLESPHCKLESLRLSGCNLSQEVCAGLSSVLSSQSSSLTELDLSNNHLQDSGLKKLCPGLESPHCKLESLRLSGCLLTSDGCASLVSALSSNPSHLRELDLSYNHPGESAVKLLSAGLEDPRWRLDLTLLCPQRPPSCVARGCRITLYVHDAAGSTFAEVCQQRLKTKLKEKYQCVFEGVVKAGNPTLLQQIYTELYITEGGTGEVNHEHEVRQIEAASRRPDRAETTIRQEDVLKLPPGRDEPIRTVMTKGVAGIGKTVLTQKFTLDWAEGRANQDIHFMFPFTFRELNVMKERKFSLVEIVHHFFTETKEICSFEDFQVVFIFDGLDECRLPLDFHNNEILTDVTESTSVDVLMTNLIRGNLLPSARLWITTRPAAANQIPSECVSMVREVRGFTNPQKEEYFRKRFRDEEQTSRIISHIKTSRSLHIMCHIPVFCWITATVLETVLEAREGGGLPKTLTEMYTHFLVVQTKLKKVKYDGEAETDPHWSPESRKMMESLGKLAFEQLQKGNLIFYESDLRECGIDIREASVYSGVFTQIFKEEIHLYQHKVFCFIHLSVQEFLAALHVHLTFINSGVNLLQKKIYMLRRIKSREVTLLYRSAVDKALQSPNGHLDLFLRFLLGLSLETNQTLLRGLLEPKQESSQNNQGTITYIKKKISGDLSAEKSINLFHCLNELNEGSLVEEVQQSLRSGRLSTDELSPAQWSALVFILLSSEEDLEVFDLKKYSASKEVLLRLLPVVKASKKVLLSGCNLSEEVCADLSSVLSSQSSSLTELDLSNNHLQDSGLEKLCPGLESPHCKLESLRLSDCNLSEEVCAGLSSVLSSQSSSLTELDLSNNHLQDSGLEKLCPGLESPHCKLESLRLSGCNLSEEVCAGLSSVLSSQSSSLTELDLSNNHLQDSGLEKLCPGLESPHCKLESLRLSGCLLTSDGCASLVSALSSNPSHLRELDLSYNHPGESAVKLLSAGLEDPRWRLDTLRVEPAGPRWLRPGLRKYSCQLSIHTNTVHKHIKLSDNNRKMTRVEEDQSYPDHPDRFDSCHQLLCREVLTGRCYWEVQRSGDVDISVSYRRIRRKGNSVDCVFGWNDHSWSLDCSDGGRYSVYHNNRRTSSSSSSSFSDRVAVYVDVPAGTLSFYSVSSDRLIHLHTFNTTFTEPLYPGFGFWSWSGSSVSLCSV